MQICNLYSNTSQKNSFQKKKEWGHSGAIVSVGKGRAENKINAFKDAGIEVLDIPYLFEERIKITLC